MDNTRREFLKRAYKIGGISALISLGLSYAKAQALVVGYSRTFGGGVTCSGAFDSGQYESFESGTGAFCTTGPTETDTEGVIDTYSTDFANCGTHSLKLSTHSSTAGFVTFPITDDTTFTTRFYFQFPDTIPTFTNLAFANFRDSASAIEMAFTIRHDSGAWKIYTDSAGIYFAITPATKYYVVITWLGDGTTDGTKFNLYNSVGTELTPVGGSGNDIVSTETDGISQFNFTSFPNTGTIYIDDVVVDHASGDLSGGQTCN